MEIALLALALSPLGAVLALLAVALRRQRQRQARIIPYRLGGSEGPPDAGVREPRRPLVPAGAGSASLPMPEEAVPGGAAPTRRLTGRGSDGDRLAS